MMKPGGVRRDLDHNDFSWILKELDKLLASIDMLKGAVMDDPVIHARLKGIGILTKEQIINYSALGPTARASGVAIDVRKDHPYAAYDRVKWKVITQEAGDVFAKAVVRILEMYESISIIRQCLVNMPAGEIDSKPKEVHPGDGIGHAEAPRGEVFHFCRSDGSNRPVRYKVRAPSYMNITTNYIAAVGGTVSDAAIVLAAIDPCYCCTERMAVIDINTGKTVYNGQDLIRLSQEKTEKLRKTSR
jgi:NADH-quinone oxidoreductase subunit D